MTTYRCTGFLVLFVMILAVPAQADIITVFFDKNQTGNPNDCSGLFGKFSDPCDVGYFLDPMVEVSPIIAKYEVDEDKWETNPDFLIDPATAFTLTGILGSSGTWSYNLDDPVIRYVVAKASDGFYLTWEVENSPAVCSGGSYNLDCLSLAQTMTSGSWSTGQNGLSHISFYDSGPVNVAEPSTLLLLSTGLAVVYRTRFFGHTFTLRGMT